MQEDGVASEPIPLGPRVPTPAPEPEGLSLRSTAGRWVIAATVLGSGIVFIDSTVVNIALPVIGRDFGTGIAALQWTVIAYTLTLAAFLLIGGALGDRYGRRRIFVIGVTWFAAASLLCGLAPSIETLIAARALQGVGGALLTPGSLAILQATFRPSDRAAAIGAWSGLGGIAIAIGPFVGGYLIEAVSWRLIFLINLPLALAVIWIARRHVPETRDPAATGRLDAGGGLLTALGLGALTFAVIEGPAIGWTSAPIILAFLTSAVALVAFIALERRSQHPMLPLSIFRSRQFSSTNVVTLLVYGALGGALFLIPVQLQQVLGYSPLGAGIALLPITLVMLALSARAGRLSQRIGPRLPMTLGPLVAGLGLALLSRVQDGTTYAGTFLPAILVFAFGLTLTVSPLTATVLAAAPSDRAGVASAINNTAARAAGLVAVAALPVVVGLTGSAYLQPALFATGFRHAMWLAGALCALGGVVAFVTIRGGERRRAEQECYSCPLDAPPVAPEIAQTDERFALSEARR
jgi:EmrB/QacA subfamily drug resistance transporter